MKTNRLNRAQFEQKYPDAAAYLPEAREEHDGMGTVLGEVKIPGHGWHACVMDEADRVTHFASDDDGWQEAPQDQQ